MNLEIKDNKLYVSFQYNPATVEKVNKNGLGMTWYKKTKTWAKSIDLVFIQSFLQLFPEQRQFIDNNLPEFLLKKKIDIDSFDQTCLLPALMKHQSKGVINAFQNPRWLFKWDCGIGKTLLSIEIIYQFIKKGLIRKALILCPLSIIEAAWIEDIKEFRPELSVVNLWLVKKKKKDIIQHIKYNDITIINYESFKLISERIQSLVQCVICDESSKLKNPKSQITKATIKFCDNMDYVYLLSGLPAPNTPMEYWAQFRIIAPLLLGYNYYNFRDKYFYICKTMIKRSKEEGKKDIEINMYKLNETFQNDFYNRLAQGMEVVKKHDVILDLPPYTINIREVFLSPTERKYYEQMKNRLLIELDGETVIARSAITKIMKLRQGSSGFFISEDGEIVETGESKLNELTALINELGDQQIIIWYFFHHEGDRIQKLLTDMGKTWCRADGTIANKTTMYQKVNNFINGQIQILIAHPQSVGHGWTFVNCSNVIRFSQSHSLELDHQSFERTYRKGQNKGVNYYNLIAKNTIDIPIYQCLREKKKADETVIDYIQYGQKKLDEAVTNYIRFGIAENNN